LSKFNHKASPEIFRRAKELREQMTQAEQVLWGKLRANRLNGLHFRRQHPISKFIVDFYCHQHRLVIELNGEVHEEKDQIERDLGREEELKALGLQVLRFSNDTVIYGMEYVLGEIQKTIFTPPNLP
jgi:Uncharacterized protein conserved in bacteria